MRFELSNIYLGSMADMSQTNVSSVTHMIHSSEISNGTWYESQSSMCETRGKNDELPEHESHILKGNVLSQKLINTPTR